MSHRSRFLRLSETAVNLSGHRMTLFGTTLLVAAWTAAGTTAGFPTEWYIVTNTVGTSMALFLLLLMQHSQNRDMHALQVKIDELIRSGSGGDHWIGVERREAHELEQMIADRQ